MAYNGYLIQVGSTPLPMKFIKLDGYAITPNQRMESEAKRAITGLLHRTTVEHTATKVEFNTPNMTNLDLDEMMSIFRSAWTSTIERKLNLQYYDMETNSYKSGEFYMPDIKFQIDHIDSNLNLIVYKETRIAFIEY